MDTTTNASLVTPLNWRVPQHELDDLTARVRSARLPGVLGDGSDETGFTTAQAGDLLQHWRERFDWRRVEEEIMAADHLLVDVSATTGQTGQRVHVLRERATSPTGVPVVLLHGWPDSFLRYRHLTGLLAAVGHDVYVPSLPGFGFSDQPQGPATVEAAAEAVGAALDTLGAARCAVHGGDWGSAVAEQLAIARPDLVTAVHLSDVPWQHLFEVDRATVTATEQEFLEAGDAWAAGASYVSVQATQSTTLALALADSPLGLAAWWAEKYLAWSDGPVGWDEVLTQVCLTWFTRTEHAGMRYYAAMGAGDWEDDGASGGWDEPSPVVSQPAAVAVFPADIGVPPREYAARVLPGLTRFTVMPRGGHFAALEHPALLADDLVAFLRGC